MKSQDIFILLNLVSILRTPANQAADSSVVQMLPSARELARLTGEGKTKVNASMNRSFDVGLAKISAQDQSISVNTRTLLEFIVHRIKLVFPVRPAELVRGLPTANSANKQVSGL